ncbi:MAG: hypothetical protein ACI97R_000717, partial [Candidatus Azotimanducaceae bacterium]
APGEKKKTHRSLKPLMFEKLSFKIYCFSTLSSYLSLGSLDVFNNRLR